LSHARGSTKSGTTAARRDVATVSALSSGACRGILTLEGMSFPCALGRAGCRARKREGDGATPAGLWRLRAVLYRSDRVRRPRTHLPVRAIRQRDGWCDAPADRNYNRPVRHPYPASAERLWRTDALYDIVVVLDYNDRPRVRGRGSAIFMHVAKPGYAPTEGCIALARPHLLRLLERMGSRPAVAVLATKKAPEAFASGVRSTYRGSGVLRQATRSDGARTAPQGNPQ
jgi:L,D-peptidoglycan transpeptidase YkuD (ErfK/YbiS/YcfS/YnhG family)